MTRPGPPDGSGRKDREALVNGSDSNNGTGLTNGFGMMNGLGGFQVKRSWKGEPVTSNSGILYRFK